MGKQLHLFQRGRIYYWRRRIPGFSTEFDSIQLSLRTEVRSEAYIISRKLTSESDRMFDDLTRNLISSDDMRRWMSHVITEELARIRRVQLVTKMDPQRDAASDARADWATATAWKLMAEFGPRAELSQDVTARLRAAGADDADLSVLELTLSMLARDMVSEPRMNRIRSGFQAVTGQSQTLSALELLELRRLLIEGCAAAHRQGDAARGIETRTADDLAAQIVAGLEAPLCPASLTAPALVGAVGEPPALDAIGEVIPPTAPRAAPMPDFDPSIMATTERLNLARYEQRRQERKHKVLADGTPEPVANDMEKSRLATARLFRQITGIHDLRQVRPGQRQQCAPINMPRRSTTASARAADPPQAR